MLNDKVEPEVIQLPSKTLTCGQGPVGMSG